jgi:hypothetical protein
LSKIKKTHDSQPDAHSYKQNINNLKINVMNKKFACPICGYVHEGENAPEICPQCKQKVQWNVLEEGAALNFVTEHVIGIAKGTGEDMIKDLNAHFMG